MRERAVEEDGGPDLVDVRTAGRLANRSPETIRRWVWSGRLFAHRQGNRLLVSRRDVAALMAEGASEPVLTLTEWAEEARQARAPSAPGSGRSAADLVLEDRRLRSARGEISDRR